MKLVFVNGSLMREGETADYELHNEAITFSFVVNEGACLEIIEFGSEFMKRDSYTFAQQLDHHTKFVLRGRYPK